MEKDSKKRGTISQFKTDFSPEVIDDGLGERLSGFKTFIVYSLNERGIETERIFVQ